jgi:hypothetical protein
MDDPIKKTVFVAIGIAESIREQIQQQIEAWEEQGKRSSDPLAQSIKNMLNEGYRAFDEQRTKVENQVKQNATNSFVGVVNDFMENTLDGLSRTIDSVEQEIKRQQARTESERTGSGETRQRTSDGTTDPDDPSVVEAIYDGPVNKGNASQEPNHQETDSEQKEKADSSKTSKKK